MGTVLITGTSSGLGLASAVELAGRGERVFASMRDTSRSKDLLDAATVAEVDVEVVQLDVTDPRSVGDAVDKVLALSGRIDAVVNNAGVASLGPLEYTTDDEVQCLFDTNVFGPLRLIRAVLPSMRAAGRGRIINISSIAAHPRMGSRLWGLYAASKAAISALTLELCKEVAPLGIDVVLLEGQVGGRTAMTDQVGERMLAFHPESSPYKLVEKVVQEQLAVFANGSLPGPAASAMMVADACTIDSVPLRFPPEAQAEGDSSDRLDDEAFVRLASLDPSLALYENAPRFWRDGRPALNGR